MVQDEGQNGLGESLSDTQSGLLMTMFVLTFMTLSPVFGYMGDRVSRKWICIIGVAAWCLFTFTGSYATVRKCNSNILHNFCFLLKSYLSHC